MRYRIEGLDYAALTLGDQQISESVTKTSSGWNASMPMRGRHAGGTDGAEQRARALQEGRGRARRRAPANRLPGDRENFEAAQEDLRRSGSAFEFQGHGVAHDRHLPAGGDEPPTTCARRSRPVQQEHWFLNSSGTARA